MPLLNFMRMLMLKTTSKFPGKKSNKSEPMYPDVKLAAILKSIPKNQNFLFASKDSGKILKIAREHLGNDKIVKLPTLIQTIVAKIKNLFAK